MSQRTDRGCRISDAPELGGTSGRVEGALVLRVAEVDDRRRRDG
jgi:hypothetical protein